ncbi:MAG: hypothetical protein ACFHXK_19425 [bacterium]
MRTSLLRIWITAIIATTSLSAAAEYDLTNLQEALQAHKDSWINKDPALLVKTSHFPNTQFYPNGRTVVLQTEADSPDISNYPKDIKMPSSEMVLQDKNIAIVRVYFEETAPDGEKDTSSGLWCFNRLEGEWKVLWRQFLGSDSP